MPPRTPKYVKLPSWDDGSTLDDVFFEDPRTWTPEKDKFGRIEYWGIQSDHNADAVGPDNDLMAYIEKMRVYDSEGGVQVPLEEQRD